MHFSFILGRLEASPRSSRCPVPAVSHWPRRTEAIEMTFPARTPRMLPRISWPSLSTLTVSALLFAVSVPDCYAGKLHVGGATVSITPDRPIALAGQMHTRIAREVESPVTATALALESRDGDKMLDQAILISCDLVAIDSAVLEQVRRRVKTRLLDFDVQKLLLSATHTHTAPVMKEGE